MVNDSSILLNDRQTTAQMAASYNYHLYQKEALQNAEKSYRATISLIIISILSVIILLVASYLIYRNRRKQQRLQEAYESAVDKREDLLKELEALRAHDYDTLISQKEDKIKEQNQTIAELEGRSGKVSLRDFKESQIVKTFAEKSQFSKDHPVPNKAEWDMLEQQFRTDMPGLCRLFEDKGLSDLEFRTCLLLLLDYDEGTIAGLTQSSSQTINSAKVRANQKLFNEKGAKSLHRALKKLI
jgi:type II secretory pathway pseudopilin PulG